jgi:hypothetical protein
MKFAGAIVATLTLLILFSPAQNTEEKITVVARQIENCRSSLLNRDWIGNVATRGQLIRQANVTHTLMTRYSTGHGSGRNHACAAGI